MNEEPAPRTLLEDLLDLQQAFFGMITPADSLGPLAIVRSTLFRRWPSVDTMRLFEPSISKNSPFR
jgi:hypothetical protein